MAKGDAGTSVVWLREDLRLDDNPALHAAAERGGPVIPVFVLDDESKGLRPLGGAHRWWLHHSLEALGKAFGQLGTKLVLRRGESEHEIADIVRTAKADRLYMNRRYDESGRRIDAAIAERLGKDGVEVHLLTGTILHEPEKVETGSGGYYRVYSPFMRKLREGGEPRKPIPAPENLEAPQGFPRSDALGSWGLLPTKPDWSGGLAEAWTPGETAARERLDHFCDELLADYEGGRERPADDATSRLSPHLRFGEISPYRLWHDASATARRRKSVSDDEIETFRRELLWRDFNTHLLFHFPALGTRNFNERFDKLRWRRSKSDLHAWQKGQTGYPIVDAGMRQLWQTGWMHNRVRMITGSFLTRDLLIDWREGEAWFWDTLVDGDPASNTSQWQWIAGTGADAQPFFRIFNPLTQSRKFDPTGAYIRRFVPELAELPADAIHAPFEADAAVLEKAGVELGKTYPKPIVAHDEARARALEAYEAVKG